MVDRAVVRRGAAAVGEPLVERILKGLFAGVLPAAGLPEPVDEVALVVVTEQHLAHRFAVDGPRDVTLVAVCLAVDQPAGVTGLTDQRRQADDALALLGRHLRQRLDRPVGVEDDRLLEPPAAEADTHFCHTRPLATTE
ncbi:hypothetical protein GJ629_05035 [Halapricum sp. CBA1109]|nr:hypothetical protein [Halapricum sp. CBA1109]